MRAANKLPMRCNSLPSFTYKKTPSSHADILIRQNKHKDFYFFSFTSTYVSSNTSFHCTPSKMKFAAYISVLSTLLMAAFAEVAWYDANRNVTCAGHDDGHIQCEEGHLNEAETVSRTCPMVRLSAKMPGR